MNKHHGAPISGSERARRSYLENQIGAAAPEEMVLELFSGLLGFCSTAEAKLDENDWAAFVEAVGRARRIVAYLSSSLHRDGGEISEHLRSLYAFCFEHLGKAGLEKDRQALKAVTKVIGEIRDGWQEMLRSEAAVATSGAEDGS